MTDSSELQSWLGRKSELAIKRNIAVVLKVTVSFSNVAMKLLSKLPEMHFSLTGNFILETQKHKSQDSHFFIIIENSW